MNLKRHEFDIIEKKLQLQCRNSGDRIALFIYNGKKILATKRSHARGDLPAANHIRQQLKLSEDQLRDLLACTFGMDEYVQHLRDRGFIQ
jgi:hypothetical protein